MTLDILRKQYIQSIKPLIPNNFKKHVTVFSPLRANFSAGWNDTPPYCNEVPGFTLNIPITYANQFPINVNIEKINSSEIILSDNFSEIKITKMSELLHCQSPSIPFALHKASILASGLIPFDINFNLQKFLNINGGFKLKTEVIDIPIGSGLGTSSILIYSCIKAIFMFCDKCYNNIDLFHLTTCAEQIMNTGGGYQDAIGSCGTGFKLISFKPGLKPYINCNQISINSIIKKQLQDRVIFIYTGKTRVAKNLLSTIMKNYINNDYTTVQTLKEIGDTALAMKDDLIKRKFKFFFVKYDKKF